MNKLCGIITEKNIFDFNIIENIYDNQKKVSSYNYLLVTNNNEPFIKYDCQDKYIIIYNGILTNKKELKCKLRTLGYQFKTNLDEEIIICAYIYYKENCLNYLKGVYSFAIYGNNKLIIVRDKLGVKPLFYTIKDNYFAFSNEIKTLLNTKLSNPIVDEIGIKELFTLGPSFTPSLTPFKEIKMLKPGEYIIYENGNIYNNIYYKLPIYTLNKSYDNIEQDLYLLINNSIANLLNGVTDYGALLSGGIDSSIVAFLLSKNKKIDTYFLEYNNNNLYFKSNNYQKSLDRDYAEIMSNNINSNHKVLTITEEELYNYLIDSLKSRDLPGMGDIDSSLFWLCKNINNDYLFTGECSDEIFGGYPWFYKKIDDSLYPWIRNINFRQELLNDKYQYLNLKNYLEESYNKLMEDYQDSPLDDIEDKKWRKMTFINIYGFMQQLLYRQEMITSSNNIVALSPFIDVDLVEYVYNVPKKYKYKNNSEKHLLKNTFKKYLPTEIIERTKNPYPKTFSPIYHKIIKDKLLEYLNNPNSTINRFFKKEKILELINNDIDKPYYGQLMTNDQYLSFLIQFEEWVKIYNVKFEI